ncbi:MAG: zinc ribbon domain-containing protein [Chloroflexi bacterium]|nr:zinc ribbon domain-containing protein [Chloroflexota bacterium]MDA8187166.1 zinc ribbon domain-containing protein [Dehalococcoidales bacterium]
MFKARRLLGVVLSLALLAVPSLAGLGLAPAVHGSWGGGISNIASMMRSGMVGHVFAEGEAPRVKQMKLSVWPEYDEPRVLVMYDGEFADKSGYPREVSFRLPKGADISQVCGISDKGEHLCQLYETKQDGDYIVLTYSVPVPHFFLEYYFNPVGSDAVRNLAYTFSATYPTDKLDVEIQQPLRSSDFTITPAAQLSNSDKDGFKYSLLSYKKLNQDQKVELNVSYSKQDNRPSVAKKQQGAPGGSVDTGNVNLWALLGGSALFGLAAFYVVSRRPGRLSPRAAGYGPRAGGQPNYSKATVYSKQTGRSKATAKVQGASQFCTNCGTPMETGDHFCAGCGARSKNVR